MPFDTVKIVILTLGGRVEVAVVQSNIHTFNNNSSLFMLESDETTLKITSRDSK
ncbi:hypothetical protein Glove_25g8 [Diversispora epigaea]|uniref:Uncharacterized protein n=1 Tax=Diversispora epigaea TaxID=1348612 RepID=A0A397JTK8_9GLOM|nr:hypothetical protein Glove_25g8 [Diversispora epigaea]